jgi:hypothetical protein
MIRHHSLFFDLRAKARRLVSQHGIRYYCGLFTINDRWKMVRRREQGAGNLDNF